MNLDEFRQALASDATKENKQLKSEINLLRKQLHDSKNEYDTLKSSLIPDCESLANRCWVLTRGTMCCFCNLGAFKCPHAMSDDQKIEAANKMMGGIR